MLVFAGADKRHRVDVRLVTGGGVFDLPRVWTAVQIHSDPSAGWSWLLCEALREAGFQWSSSRSRLPVKLFAKPTSSEALREADFQWSSSRSRLPVKLFAKPSSSEALREADFQWRSSFSIKVLHQAASRRSSSWSDLPHELGMGGVSGTKNSVCLN